MVQLPMAFLSRLTIVKPKENLLLTGHPPTVTVLIQSELLTELTKSELMFRREAAFYHRLKKMLLLRPIVPRPPTLLCVSQTPLFPGPSHYLVQELVLLFMPGLK